MLLLLSRCLRKSIRWPLLLNTGNYSTTEPTRRGSHVRAKTMVKPLPFRQPKLRPTPHAILHFSRVLHACLKKPRFYSLADGRPCRRPLLLPNECADEVCSTFHHRDASLQSAISVAPTTATAPIWEAPLDLCPYLRNGFLSRELGRSTYSVPRTEKKIMLGSADSMRNRDSLYKPFKIRRRARLASTARCLTGSASSPTCGRICASLENRTTAHYRS